MQGSIKRIFVYFLLLTNLWMMGGYIAQSLEQSSEKIIVKSKDTINFELLAEIEESEFSNVESYQNLPVFFVQHENLFNKQLQHHFYLNKNESEASLIDHQTYFCVFRI